jgi:hypothetical protein
MFTLQALMLVRGMVQAALRVLPIALSASGATTHSMGTLANIRHVGLNIRQFNLNIRHLDFIPLLVRAPFPA